MSLSFLSRLNWSTIKFRRHSFGRLPCLMSDAFLRRIASGALWSYAALLGGRIIVFAGLALAARVLSPNEFGEFAMAMTVVSFLEVVRGFGMQRALIYFGGKSGSETVWSTGFSLSIGLGLALGGGLVAAAPMISEYYGVPAVRDYVMALSLYFVIGALGLVPDVVMRNRLDFRQRFLPETAAPMARYLLAVGCALLGYGAWSLVIGQVGGMIVNMLLTFWSARWTPRLGFDARTAKQLIGFGWQMSTVDLCAALTLNADYLFVGRFLGTENLGLYSLAFRLPDTTIVAVAFAVAQLLLPAYVRLGADPATLRTGFLETTRYLGMVLIPATAGLVLLAPALVDTLFGAPWQHAAPLVQLLAISALLRALVFAPGAVFVSAGRPSLAVFAELVCAGVSVPLFYLAAQRDVTTVAGVQVLSVAVYGAVKIGLLRTLIHVSWLDVVRPLWASAVATLTMSLALLMLAPAHDRLGSALYVLAGIVVGTFTYAATLWNLDRVSIVRVSALLRSQRAEVASAGT
ncbi:MAG: lipopolysaccharide biosynthesis protein [Chloroflexota bacterium]